MVLRWSQAASTSSDAQVLRAFDPAANNFTVSGPMSVARSSPAATRLPDGRVLVTGKDDGRNGGQVRRALQRAVHSVAAFDVTARRRGAGRAELPGQSATPIFTSSGRHPGRRGAVQERSVRR
jgi:hypothetical protein